MRPDYALLLEHIPRRRQLHSFAYAKIRPKKGSLTKEEE